MRWYCLNCDGATFAAIHIVVLSEQTVSIICCSATANPDGQPRALLVGGGIANFTDVAATFKGIIKVSRPEIQEASLVQAALSACAAEDDDARRGACS